MASFVPLRSAPDGTPDWRPPRQHSRRRLLQSLLAGGLGATVSGAQGLDWLHNLGEGTPSEVHLLSQPVTVPHDFAGLHMHRWPVGTPPSPAPSFGYGAVRSHDFDGAAWYRIHLARQQYDWSRLDRWVAVHAAAGKTLVYTLYGTPAWIAERSDQRDLYGHQGGAAPPRDLEALTEFVTALIQRYNGDGRRRLHVIETWNEPHFDNRSDGFWWGSAAQLVAVGRAAYKSAKQVDPGVRVLSPGFVGDLAGALSLRLPLLVEAERSPVYQYLTSPDGHGGVGSRWCDGLAFHTYNVPPRGENAGYLLGIRKLQTMLTMMKLSLPIFNTELGFTATDPFHQLTPMQQGASLRRVAAVQAALGVRALFFYAFDDDLVGNPSRYPEVARAIGDVNVLLAGKLLQQVTLQTDGRVEIVTSERTLQW